jgi:hypothetical protein
MDPFITPIVAAIAAGATAGLKEEAAQVVKDAYAAVKSFLSMKYPKVNLGQIEEKPTSSARQAVLAEDLADSGADQDPELLRLVEALAAVPTVGQILEQTITAKDHGIAQGVMFGDIHNYGSARRTGAGDEKAAPDE